MRAVVSFANTQFYQEKMKRLKASVEEQGIKFIGYTSFEEIGCKPHSEVPYQFKPYAIQRAIEEGVTTLLWCDSPIVAIGKLTPVFEYIEKEGYMFFDNIGHPLGKWTNDYCLEKFHLTREKAMSIKQIMACCMGFKWPPNPHFDIDIPILLDRYKKMSEEGLYNGSWDDHRHDQTCMSWLLYNRDYTIINGHESFFIYSHFRNVFKIADSVCLESR